MKKWKCTVCGYIHDGDTPPEVCPVCGADSSKFIPVEPEAPAEDKKLNPTQASDNVQVEQWKCTACGYVHKGTEPPEKCPVCGADRSSFIPYVEPASSDELKHDNQASASAGGGDETTSSGRQNAEKTKWFETLKQSFDETAVKLGSRIPAKTPFTNLLTQNHGHPIAVHIPNGVLPLAVLFTFFAIVFKSESFAAAARINMLFVFLSMPVVIFTGLVDWVNQYKGRMTKVFRVKMVCAIIVIVFSFLLALWWFIQPQIYLAGASNLILFVVFNLIALGASVVAGLYGGKLVFRK